MRFLLPEFLNLFWALGAFAAWGVFSLRSLASVRLRIGTAHCAITSRPSTISRRSFHFLAGLLVLSCLIISLARPQFVLERRVPDRTIFDTVILLDTSPSMRAQDIYPSRLAKATQIIGDFIRKKLPEDRFGLVSFSQNSLVLSYLTADPNNLEFYMDYLRQQGMLQYGTNIGGALKSAMVVLARQTEIEPQMRDHKKVFVLLSDGEDYGEELKAALQEVIRRNIPVYCVGIGSRTGALIPIGEEGGKITYLLGRNDQPLITTFDESTLRQVAERSGGHFYRAQTAADLAKAFDDIFLKAREIRGYRRVREAEEHYKDFLVAAFGFFLLRVML
jgi:Ca-activated chloride channel family protein